MGSSKSYVDVACKVADVVVQERDAFIANATEEIRRLGSRHPELSARRLWDLVQDPSLGTPLSEVCDSLD